MPRLCSMHGLASVALARSGDALDSPISLTARTTGRPHITTTTSCERKTKRKTTPMPDTTIAPTALDHYQHANPGGIIEEGDWPEVYAKSGSCRHSQPVGTALMVAIFSAWRFYLVDGRSIESSESRSTSGMHNTGGMALAIINNFSSDMWAANNTSSDNETVKFITTTQANQFATGINSTDPKGSESTDDAAAEVNHVLTLIEWIGNLMSYYYVPVLSATGSLGNVLSVFVFFKSKLKKLSSSYYLSALATSDTCFLGGIFVQWLNFVDVNLYNREYCCQFFTFTSNLASFCSAWFVVAFTVERFIAVMYPLRRQTMCTVHRAKLVIFFLTTIACLHCAPFLILATPVYSPAVDTIICDIRDEYKDTMTLLNYWDTIVVFAIPFIIIVILNSFTGYTVWRFARIRRSMTVPRNKRNTSSSSDRDENSESASPPSHRVAVKLSSLGTNKSTTKSSKRQPKSRHHQKKENQQVERREGAVRMSLGGRNKLGNSSQMKVTKMLLIVSSVFVCLNLPSCVTRIQTFLETQSATNEKSTVVMQYIFQLLFITNFGINFVLYCVSGQNFRKAVISVFCHRRPHNVATNRDATLQVTVSEIRSGTGRASSRRRMMQEKCWNEMYELRAAN